MEDLAEGAEAACSIEVRPQLAPHACLAAAAAPAERPGLHSGLNKLGCEVAEQRPILLADATTPWEDLVDHEVPFMTTVLAPGSEEQHVFLGGDGWGGATSSEQSESTSGSEASYGAYEGPEEPETSFDCGVDSGSEFSVTLGSDFSAALSDPSSPPRAPRLADPIDRWSCSSHPIVAKASIVAAPPPLAAGPIGWQSKQNLGRITETCAGAGQHLRLTQSVQPYHAGGQHRPSGPVATVSMGTLNTGVLPMSLMPQTSTGFQGNPTTKRSVDGCAQCPLCKRECESHHRMGLFWQKFGYGGPPYCTRCSAVFRAHIVSQTVSNEKCKCTRNEPCAVPCTLILEKLTMSKQEAFALMDSCEASKLQVPRTLPVEAVVTCPHCADQVPSSTLGLFWRKFGYQGMPYCAICSAKFRNHIIRPRSFKRTDCSRGAPCSVCDSILRDFGQDRPTTFALMNSKSRAPRCGSTAVSTSYRRSGRGSSGGSSTDDSTVGLPGLEALAAKRRKLSEPSAHSSGGLIGSLPLAIVGVIAFCAVTAFIAVAHSGQSTNPSTANSYNCCSGGVGCGFEHCPALGDGQAGCVRRWDMPNGMNFDTDCGVPGDRSDWCKGGVTEGMDPDSVEKCFGPPHSTCQYSCLPGYIRICTDCENKYDPDATDIHMCHEGEHEFSGGHCGLDPRNSGVPVA